MWEAVVIVVGIAAVAAGVQVAEETGGGGVAVEAIAEAGSQGAYMQDRYDQQTLLDSLVNTFLSEGNFDILIGFVVFIIGCLLAFVNRVLGAIIGIGVGGYFINSFLVRLSSGQGTSGKGMRPYRAKSNEIPMTIQA